MGCCSSSSDIQRKNLTVKSPVAEPTSESNNEKGTIAGSTTPIPPPLPAYSVPTIGSSTAGSPVARSSTAAPSASYSSTAIIGDASSSTSTSSPNPYNNRHPMIVRETTASDFHTLALVGASPKTFHRLRSTFRIFVATWNVGDAEPASMAPLFAHINDGGRGADIIFIAAQECNYKPTDVKHLSARDHWNACIGAIFPDYAVVAHRGLWEMRTMLLVKNSIRDDVKDIVVSREATGVASVAGNKGGIAVGCTAYETRILFVGSHLAAHLEEVEKRNSDFFEIVEGIAKEFTYDGIEPLNYFHHVFWCGDLNYRIDLPRDEVMNGIDEKNFEKLLAHDQLAQEMSKGAVFAGGFAEAATPTFIPTYRFLRNTDPTKERVYDDFKNRIPSWCDRILHKPLGSSVDVAHTVGYGAEHQVRSSDHSPVFAIFDVNSREKMREGLEQRELAWLVSQHQLQQQQQQQQQKINNEADELDQHLLVIGDVRAFDLLDADVGENNLSDPFIIFRIVGISSNDDPTSFAKTPVIADSLNPEWKNQVFTIDLGSRIDVGMHYLHCVVMDDDVIQDDALGQAVIPLDRVWELRNSKDTPLVRLESPVMSNGRQYGSVTLTMMIKKKSGKEGKDLIE